MTTIDFQRDSSPIHQPSYSTAIQNALKKTLSSFHVPSIAAGVYHNGNTSYYCLGRRSLTGGAIDENTIFPVASLSKAFIATALIILEEEGRLSLDGKVSDYLTSFQTGDDELTRQVTIRDCLIHQSGYAELKAHVYSARNCSLDAFVHKLRYIKPAFALRERFCYSNHMYAALSLLIEEVTGCHWGTFIKERIFDKLGMTRAFTKTGAYKKTDDNYARPHLGAGPFSIPFVTFNTEAIGGAGSLSMSLKDILRWTKANLRGGENIFSAGSAEELHTPAISFANDRDSILPFESKPSTFQYALGWFVTNYCGEKTVYHTGAIEGYRSICGFIPGKNLAFAVLTNQSSVFAPEAAAMSITDIICGREGRDWNAYYTQWAQTKKQVRKKKNKQTLRSSIARPDITGIPGEYENPAFGKIKIRESFGGLIVRQKGFIARLVPIRKDEFVIDVTSFGFTFPCRISREDGQTVIFIQFDEDAKEPYMFVKL